MLLCFIYFHQCNIGVVDIYVDIYRKYKSSENVKYFQEEVLHY